MLHKLQMIREIPNNEKLKYVEDMGNYNHLPTPCIKSTFKEFYRIFHIYSATHTDFRQIFDNSVDNGSYRLYFYGDVGYAVKWDYDDPNNSTVYKIGCLHDWEILVSRMCYSKSKCRKCGCVKERDSSD